jgi:hypothetical protein
MTDMADTATPALAHVLSESVPSRRALIDAFNKARARLAYVPEPVTAAEIARRLVGMQIARANGAAHERQSESLIGVYRHGAEP